MGLGMSVSAEHGDGRVAQPLRVEGLARREDAGLHLLAGGADGQCQPMPDHASSEGECDLANPTNAVTGHGVFDSRDFLVPQSRARVYVWAACPAYAAWVASWHKIVALCRPRARLSLSACFL